MSRRNFTMAIKRAAAKRAAGRCECCGLPTDGKPIEFDHDKEDTFGGEPTLENCRVICIPCHRSKTAERARVIAKSNRLRDRRMGVRKSRRTIPGRKFNGDPIPSKVVR
jgi:5-methylcytosine-specific restriction protein A